MNKRFLAILLISFVLMLFSDIAEDKATLKNNLIRLHVVANSDSQEDQTVKIAVKDAVCEYLEPILESITSVETAKNTVNSHLDSIQLIAEKTLQEQGFHYASRVSFCEESFDTREYDTFTLPAGVYQSLRIELGNGNGKNWWCVVFPALCLPSTQAEFGQVAAASGFDDVLTDTIATKKSYKIRFFILDCFGEIENLFIKKN